MINRDIELGYGTVTKAAMQDRELTIQAKAIYAYLCSFAGGKDEAWPSYSRMCYDLCCTDKTIRKHMKLLELNGYVSINRSRYTKSQKFANNYYSIEK